MQRLCAAIGTVTMLGIVTPEVGVAQGPSTRPAVQLTDSLLAANADAGGPPATGAAVYHSGAIGSESLDTPEAHRARSIDYEIDPFAAVVPYGPGERLEYKVKAGIFNAGEAHIEILGTDSVRGRPTYHVEMDLRGSAFFGAFKVRNHYDSWIDTELIMSHRFYSDVSSPGHSAYRSFEFYPDEMYWDNTDDNETGELGTALPLDDVSFLYFVRSLPLEVGQTYTIPRYFKKDGNPIVLEVVGRDVREVGAGTFNTIVVRPTIKTSSLYKEGGDAELHFTDDENRYLVYMRVGMPLVGSLTLHLENIVEGTPIHSGETAW